MKMHFPAVYDWRRIYRALAKSLLVVLVLAVSLFLWVTISFNRLQPSEVERNQAIVLAKEIDKSFGFGKEVVLWDASRGRVTVYVYGILDARSQNKIVNRAVELLQVYPFEGKVSVQFFPAREYTVSIQNGRQVRDLIHEPLLREEQLQP